MSNDEMRAGRFEQWARMRKLFAAITEHLKAGGRVQVSTYTHSTVYQPKHLAMFRCGKTGVYVQSGKRWNDIHFSGIRLID